MAGILANSASVTMVSGDTQPDNTFNGYLNQERVTLTVTPAGSTYSWSMARPTDAGTHSDLDDDDAASVSFTPDVAGYYTLVCRVDGTTTYILRISITDTVTATSREAMRFMPKADAQIATPSAGVALYYSSDQDALCIKDAAGVVSTVDVTPA